jgi:hypothetical protein
MLRRVESVSVFRGVGDVRECVDDADAGVICTEAAEKIES